MVGIVRPQAGGFIRPFGCGWFIREYLLGHGPEGSPKIDPTRGAPQSDIRHHYKEALWHAMARDRAEREVSDLVGSGEEVTAERAAEIETYHFGRIPKKLTRMRYHSFVRYFGLLRQLGWVKATGEEEKSEFQDHYPPAQPRRYYALTAKGKRAPIREWSNPLATLYGHLFPPEYFREHRKGRRYV